MQWSQGLGIDNQIVIIDGLSGSGKSMLSKVLGSLNGFSTPRFFYPLEWMLHGAANEAVTQNFFGAWFRLLTNQLAYDFLVSREVNFRPSDLSSVLRSSGALSALSRLFKSDGPQVFADANLKGITLITHQSFDGFQAARNASTGGLLWVEIVRRPIDLVTHWASYIDRYGTSATDFTLLQSVEGFSLPWFVDNPQFISGNTATKTLLALVAVCSRLNNFEEEVKGLDNALVIPFEKFVVKPRDYLRQIEKATASDFGPSVERVLRAQKLPRLPGPGDWRGQNQKRYQFPQEAHSIIDQAPSSLRDEFLELDRLYVDRHGLGS